MARKNAYCCPVPCITLRYGTRLHTNAHVRVRTNVHRPKLIAQKRRSERERQYENLTKKIINVKIIK